MAEYIDIDAQVVVTDTRGCEHETTVRHIFEMNKGVYTAADVVERKTGKWIDMGDFEQCSACKGTHLKEFESYYGKVTWIKTPYCPHCGAKMIGGDEDV